MVSFALLLEVFVVGFPDGGVVAFGTNPSAIAALLAACIKREGMLLVMGMFGDKLRWN